MQQQPARGGLVRTHRSVPPLPEAVAAPFDVALGAAAVVAGPGLRALAALTTWARPVVGALVQAAAHPPLVPEPVAPASIAQSLQRRGNELRRAVAYDVRLGGAATADALVPAGFDLVLTRVDLTELVLDRVDLGRLVDAALDQADVTGLVLERVDLVRIVDAVLAELDLTEVVLDRVDLGRVVTAALDTLDLTEIVRSRVDLTTIADEVIEDVDLPEIIRESSSGVASDAVQGARIGMRDADERVAGFIDRVLLRRRDRTTAAPASPDRDEPA